MTNNPPVDLNLRSCHDRVHTTSRTMKSTESELSCSELLRVLAEETRLAVVRHLITGPKHVGQINEDLNAEQSLLSHHMKVLRDAGLVVAKRDGKAVLYQLAPQLESARRGNAIHLGCCRLSFDV